MGDDIKGQLSRNKRAVEKSTEWHDEEGGRRLEDEPKGASMMTWEMTSNGNLEPGINLKKVLFGFCHWGFEVMMEGVSNVTLTSSEAMGSSLGTRGQDLR